MRPRSRHTTKRIWPLILWTCNGAEWLKLVLFILLSPPPIPAFSRSWTGLSSQKCSPFDYTTDPHTDPKNGNRGNVSTALKVKATLGTISQRPLGFTVDETSAPSLCMGRCCLKVRNRIDDVNTSSFQHHITIKRFPAILSALQKNHRCGLWTPS